MRVRSKDLPEAHPLDRFVGWLSRGSRMFARGWGDEKVIENVARRERYLSALPAIEIQWGRTHREGQREWGDGDFRSPLEELPEAVKTVQVRRWSRAGNEVACVMPAASRDEGYKVRERVFGPLVDSGIDLYFLENPFYGQRRDGRGPSDITVAEHCLIALGIVLESRALLEHLKPGYPKLVAAGYSMGGHLAALAAAVSPFPVACAALATGASPAPIYTVGLLSQSIDFAALGGEAGRERLREIIDGADITKFRPPLRADAAVVSGSRRDGYVLASETQRLHQHWKGSELRMIDAGHFSALITQREALRACVLEAVRRL